MNQHYTADVESLLRRCLHSKNLDRMPTTLRPPSSNVRSNLSSASMMKTVPSVREPFTTKRMTSHKRQNFRCSNATIPPPNAECAL
eukprot:2380988-Amphidinium_carterae.1